MGASLGIAITTYNRREMVLAQIAALQRLTSCEFDLVVCDDGSSDGTVEALVSCGAKVVGGVNRGIAWNKNRGLFYLREIRGSQTILLLDDDVLPTVNGWEEEWLEGVRRYGHINWCAPGQSVIGGSGLAADPAVSRVLAGPCIAFSRQALSYVGYMDTRFKRYGHEHTDLTCRAIHAGFGGFIALDERTPYEYFYVIEGGLIVLGSVSNHDAESVARNSAILMQSSTEPIYRHAWRTPDEYDLMRSEMAALDGLASCPAVFDPARYLEAYPDVAAAGADPIEHYIKLGIKEGRRIA